MRISQLGLALFLWTPFLAPVLECATAGAQAAPSKTIAPTTPGKVHRLILKSGSELVGRVLSIDSTSIRFESELGVATIAIDGIASFREEQPGYVRGGSYYFPNPNQTRLMFAPTGRMLKPGEGYFTDFWIFFPAFAAGLTDRVTLGGGMSIFPGGDISNNCCFSLQRSELHRAIDSMPRSARWR